MLPEISYPPNVRTVSPIEPDTSSVMAFKFVRDASNVLLVAISCHASHFGSYNHVVSLDFSWISAPQMAYTFTTSSSVRSQKNADSIPTDSPGEGTPIASGGSFKGYDFEHQYEMKNEGTSVEQPRSALATGGDFGIDNLVPYSAGL